MSTSRRNFLAGIGAFSAIGATGLSATVLPQGADCPFPLAVINDEITQDFGHACEIASRGMGLRWIELRGMWNKNLVDLDTAELAEAKRILTKYELGVTDIASPLFKVDWPEARGSKRAGQHDPIAADAGDFHARHSFEEQDQLLAHCIELAGMFETTRIRCFDFLHLDDPTPYRSAINEKLREAAVRCGKAGKILMLENEESCNTRTGKDSAALLRAIPERSFMLNWDPANAAAVGEKAYPDGYSLLPKDRIAHCHCKDVIATGDHGYTWAPVGGGVVDWVGQFQALHRDGYRHAVSLETHWHGPGTPEESTRLSMQGVTATLRKAGFACQK
jgi:L-ribulose-5-phosphate 3-epimerase